MIQVAICDDSPADILQMKKMISEIMDKYAIDYRIYEYDSGEKLLEAKISFHLIFLDIMLGGKNGMEIGKCFYRRNPSIRIIFQTNFGQCCKEAMNKSHAFAFLEKPLQITEVEEQIKEFLESKEELPDIMVGFKDVRCFSGRKEAVMADIHVSVKEIVYFEYLKKKKGIKMITEKDQYVFPEVMNRLENRMRPLGFETSCRGILVNLRKIVQIKRYDILLETGDTLPLSQRRVVKFKERINEYINSSFGL